MSGMTSMLDSMSGMTTAAMQTAGMQTTGGQPAELPNSPSKEMADLDRDLEKGGSSKTDSQVVDSKDLLKVCHFSLSFTSRREELFLTLLFALFCIFSLAHAGSQSSRESYVRKIQAVRYGFYMHNNNRDSVGSVMWGFICSWNLLIFSPYIFSGAPTTDGEAAPSAGAGADAELKGEDSVKPVIKKKTEQQ